LTASPNNTVLENPQYGEDEQPETQYIRRFSSLEETIKKNLAREIFRSVRSTKLIFAKVKKCRPIHLSDDSISVFILGVAS
jgi:hypothetical protein